MKKSLIFIILTILFLIPLGLHAQVDFSLNNYGRVRLYDQTDTRQIDRISIDFGRNDSVVHHYKDIGCVEPVLEPFAVTPTIADSEVVSIIGYNLCEDSINVEVKHHVYWWNDKNYLIVGFRVYNKTESSLKSYISFELIPQIDGNYGNETVDYDLAQEIVYVYKENSYAGIKFLSHPCYSFRSLYYSDYSPDGTYPDSLQWAEMTNPNNTEFPFSPGDDGSASFLNAGFRGLAPSDSADFYVCIAYDTSLTELQAQINDAEDIFEQNFITPTGVDLSFNKWGRVRLYDLNDNRQVDRVSITIGMDESLVYSYKGDDQAIISEPISVTTTVADSEIVSIIGYEDINPTIEIKHHIYWWSDKNWVIAGFRVYNNTGSTMQSYIGFEFVPDIDDYDVFVDYDPTQDFGYAYKGNNYTAVKLLSHPSYSFRSLYYTDYSVDGTYPDSVKWAEMTNSNNSAFPLDATDPIWDGSVSFLNAGQVEIAASDSVDFYVFIAYVTTPAELQAQVSDAVDIYNLYLAPSGIVDSGNELMPYKHKLAQNYPNPFNPTTRIQFELGENTNIELDIYDLLGNLVNVIATGHYTRGSHFATWDGKDSYGQIVSSGVYIYRLRAGDYNLHKKMILIR